MIVNVMQMYYIGLNLIYFPYKLLCGALAPEPLAIQKPMSGIM